jgi:hypothetical protein
MQVAFQMCSFKARSAFHACRLPTSSPCTERITINCELSMYRFHEIDEGLMSLKMARAPHMAL